MWTSGRGNFISRLRRFEPASKSRTQQRNGFRHGGHCVRVGPKACAVIVNAFRTGGNIYGAAAMKSAAKLLRGNAVVAGLTVVVLSSFDIADIVRGRISPGQLAKNLGQHPLIRGGRNGPGGLEVLRWAPWCFQASARS